MRPKFFFFAMLASVAASAQVTNVEPVSANYANKTVSFRVWWNAGSRDVTHLSKVWVWVDYVKVNANNTTSGNSWTRAAVSAASPTASVSYDGSNRQGFWLQGNSGSYSQIVTVALTNIPANTKFNWCAYASDCPPNMVMDGQTYYFKGTPPFILKEADGTIHEIAQISMPKANLTFLPVSITDKTECPGGLKEVIGTCPYTGTDWYADLNHKCLQRTSGAQNWEAWIKDTRDNKLYRIVYMPNNKWWLAQNLDYRDGNYKCGKDQSAYCDKYGIMLHLTDVIPADICPNGWTLPTTAQMQEIASTETQVRRLRSTTTWLGAANTTGAPGTDEYGFTLLGSGYVDDASPNSYCAENYASFLILYCENNKQGVGKIDFISGQRPAGDPCGGPGDWGWILFEIGTANDWAYIRCFRQL